MLWRIDADQYPGLGVGIKKGIQIGPRLGLEGFGFGVLQIDDHRIGSAFQRLGYPLGTSGRDKQR